MATHSSSLAWKIPWTEEPGRLCSPRSHEESDTTENWAPAPANRMTHYTFWCIWKEKMRSSKGRMEITILGSTLSKIIKYKMQRNGWCCLKTLHLYLYFDRSGQITHRNFIIDNCAYNMKWLSIIYLSIYVSIYLYMYLHQSVEGWKILCTNMLEKEVASNSSILS